MKITKPLLAVTLLALTALFVSAESVTLKNTDAVRLFSALRAIQPGLTPVNTNRVARNINALRPTIEAFEQSQLRIQQAVQAIPADDPNKQKTIIKLNIDFLAIGADAVTIDLVPVEVSDSEITAAKLSPDSIAEFLRYLSPAPPPPPAKK